MKRSQQFRKPFLNFLNHYFNPFTRRLAKSLGLFAVIHHVGRRSGKPYETPVIVQPVTGGFVIELTYGPNVDWYKNVTAAGECSIFWRNQTYEIHHIETLDTETGRAAFPPPMRLFMRLIGMRHYIKMTMH